jgi:hypothetical protein
MKKIIAVVDPFSFSEDQLIHFNAIAKLLEGKLSVVFLENVVGEILPLAKTIPYGAYPTFSYGEIDWKSLEERKKLIKDKVKLFYTICQDKNIAADLHEEEGVPLQETIKESRFADLLLINNDTTLTRKSETNPPKFVKDVLRDAQCPVLVLSSQQTEIDELVFAYNGSFSSMYAIRQFSCLAKNITSKKVTVLYVDENDSGKVEEDELLKDYLGHHYNNWEIKLLRGDPPLEIMNYLMHKPGCLITMGAYGRSKFSQFFNESNAEEILHTLNTNVFITHP